VASERYELTAMTFSDGSRADIETSLGQSVPRPAYGGARAAALLLSRRINNYRLQKRQMDGRQPVHRLVRKRISTVCKGSHAT
jgi:hypothetical protein